MEKFPLIKGEARRAGGIFKVPPPLGRDLGRGENGRMTNWVMSTPTGFNKAIAKTLNFTTTAGLSLPLLSNY
jgi:hypothetical protein